MAVATCTLGWVADVGTLLGVGTEGAAGLLAQPAVVSAAKLAKIMKKNK
jgi:hypothetical protein